MKTKELAPMICCNKSEGKEIFWVEILMNDNHSRRVVARESGNVKTFDSWTDAYRFAVSFIPDTMEACPTYIPLTLLGQGKHRIADLRGHIITKGVTECDAGAYYAPYIPKGVSI